MNECSTLNHDIGQPRMRRPIAKLLLWNQCHSLGNGAVVHMPYSENERWKGADMNSASPYYAQDGPSWLGEFSDKRRFPCPHYWSQETTVGGVSHPLILPNCFRRIHNRTASPQENDSLNYYGEPFSLVIIMADAAPTSNWQWHDRRNVHCFCYLIQWWRNIMQSPRKTGTIVVIIIINTSSRIIRLFWRPVQASWFEIMATKFKWVQSVFRGRHCSAPTPPVLIGCEWN
jgi:hypothetical protein